MQFFGESYSMDQETGEFVGTGWSDTELRVGWVMGDHDYLPGSAVVDDCHRIVKEGRCEGYEIKFHGVSCNPQRLTKRQTS